MIHLRQLIYQQTRATISFRWLWIIRHRCTASSTRTTPLPPNASLFCGAGPAAEPPKEWSRRAAQTTFRISICRSQSTSVLCARGPAIVPPRQGRACGLHLDFGEISSRSEQASGKFSPSPRSVLNAHRRSSSLVVVAAVPTPGLFSKKLDVVISSIIQFAPRSR